MFFENISSIPGFRQNVMFSELQDNMQELYPVNRWFDSGHKVAPCPIEQQSSLGRILSHLGDA